jgi:hypothetical protein
MSAPEEPWATLGIDVTDDLKAIRKAYALRLRQTRPDEDPDGFQRLVEARDFAIYLAQAGLLSAVNGPSAQDEAGPVGHLIFRASDIPSLRPEERTGSLAEIREPPPLQDASVVADDSARTERDDPIASDVQDGDPDVIRLLQALDQRTPWDTRLSKWQAVFDALEAAPFTDADWLTSVMLNELVAAMRRDVLPLEEGEMHFLTLEQKRKHMGDYWNILEDMERRFQFLHHDRVLYERLASTDADYLLAAMERVIPRETLGRNREIVETTVPDIPDAVLVAAFEFDQGMVDYYQKVKVLDRFSPSFSLPALLFPIPVLFRYRLYPLAILASIVSLTIAGLRFADGADRSFPFTPTLAILYFAVAIYTGFFWRQMRISELYKVYKTALNASLGHEDLLGHVRLWGRPNQKAMLGGICLLLVVAALRYLSR